MKIRVLNFLRALLWLLLACALFLFAPQGLFSQTVAVQSTLTDGGGGAVGGKLYMHFVLFNCGANIPINSSTSAIIKRSFDIVANSSGLATGTVVPNDLIKCGNVANTTQWTVTVMSSENSPLTQAQNYFICSSGASAVTCAQPSAGGTFNIATAMPSSTAPPAPGFIPVFENPTQTQTLTQPPGTNLNIDGVTNFAGTVNFCAATVVCGGGSSTGLPILQVATFGATGNGATDDTAAINATLAACPQASPSVGCEIWFFAGKFKITSTIAVGLMKGVHLHGVGTVGTGGCSVIIQANGAIDALTVGNGSSPDSTGFEADDICFQDMTGNGLSGAHVEAVRDAMFRNVGMIQYFTGAGYLLDGGSNFTQFVTIISPYVWQTKYPIQGSNPTNSTFKTASNYVFGGELNCQNSARTDVITGSVGIDIGYSRQVASTGTGSEWSVDTQTQNCQVGIGIWNGGGNHFWGKAVEDTLVPRGSGTICVAVTGDTPSLANGNIFHGVQCTGAGTGFYLGPNTANTSILDPPLNGTMGVDYVADAGSDGSTKRGVIKRTTGWQTNLATIARAANVVTAVTAATEPTSANGCLGIQPGTLVTVFNVTGGATSFNTPAGSQGFPTATVSTNDATCATTFTWPQTGPNESGTITAGTSCGGSQSCVGALSSVLNSGVGQMEITGDNITQDLVLQTPSIPGAGNTTENLPLTSLGGTARIYMDSQHVDIIENSGGVLHLANGPVVSYNGNASGYYAPQPTTFVGGVGTVNCTGAGPTSTCTWNGGNYFALTWTGSITINNVVYPISSIPSLTSIVITGATGTLSGVNYQASGIAGVPNCSNPIGGVCASSDDKGYLYANNTNGSTYCLPPVGAANGYPVGFVDRVEYFAGGGANFLAVTPGGQTSVYGVACPGASTLNNLSVSRNVTNQQGLTLVSDGSTWKTFDGQPSIPIDQVGTALTNNTSITIGGGNYTGLGSGTQTGLNINVACGSSNASNGMGGICGFGGGPDSASGANGYTQVWQYFNSGIGLGPKNGFIVRPCKDVTGSDCGVMPAGNNGAVRLTVSGTDTGGAVGVVMSGSGLGTPSQILVAGVHPSAIVETSCPSGQVNYYAEAASGGLDNGAGECDAQDSSRRVGYALTGANPAIVNTSGTAVTWVSGMQFNTLWTGTVTINGTNYTISAVGSATSMTLTATAGTQTGVAFSSNACSQTAPCRVPVFVQPGGNGSSGITQWASVAGCTSNGSACAVTVTWPTPFADTSYLPVCWGVGPVTGNPQPAFIYLAAAPSSASSITVDIDNRGTTNQGGFTSVYCSAHHN